MSFLEENPVVYNREAFFVSIDKQFEEAEKLKKIWENPLLKMFGTIE